MRVKEMTIYSQYHSKALIQGQRNIESKRMRKIAHNETNHT